METLLFQGKKLARLLTLLLFSSLFLVACDDDDDDDDDPMTPAPTQSIVQIAQGNNDFESLVAALSAADLVDDLSGDGPFTVFAPTDAAFDALIAGNDDIDELSDISMESLIAILQYHVASGEVLSTELMDGQTIPTLLSGESLTVGISGSTVSIGNGTVVQADILATNGVIHAVDQVLVPEGFVIELAPQSIAEIVTENENFSILLAALQASPELLAAASAPGANVTVFAPTDAAFVALLETLTSATGNTFDELSDIPVSVLTRVLQYHILGEIKTSGDLTAEETTLGGETIAIDATDGVTINGSANVVTADIMASNGVVHVIDAVLVPEIILSSLGTVLEPAIFDAEGRFTTLLAAVETADLAGALTDPEATLTVFAPTNTAFENFIAENGIADAAALLAAPNLADILLYHVLGVQVPSSAIAAGSSSAPALYDNDEGGMGEEIYISNNGENGIFLNGYAEVIIPDLEEANGVVHVIDAVLVPPTESIAGIVVAAATAEENAQFTLLLAALQNADETGGSLVDLLSSEDGTYTVFAPTDQAFIDAGFADVAAIEAADAATLRTILLYHVVPAAVFSTDLSSGAVETAGGGEITINVADPVTITDNSEASTDAEVIDVNILATNGVIHVINQVLLP
jgi:transforming growth factor-beta-induced protein